ncbi:unnamed protein product, partial [Prorocentrum cordatum]
MAGDAATARAAEEGWILRRIIQRASSLRAACVESRRRECCERSAARVKMGAVVDRFGAIGSAEYETDILCRAMVSGCPEAPRCRRDVATREPDRFTEKMADALGGAAFDGAWGAGAVFNLTAA